MTVAFQYPCGEMKTENAIFCFFFLDCFKANGREMQRMINTHIEASKIGRQIAEQVLDYQRRMGDVSSG